MPRYPVLQPDGKLAIWSTIVDHFLAFDCTQDEAVQELSQYHTGPIAETVRRTAAGEIPFEWCQDWADCVAEAHWRHGEENEAVQEAMTRTPDPMMRRYIGMCVATSKAEIAADDLRAALAAATARAEAAERNADDLSVMLSCLPEYMRYCEDTEGPALSLSEWWSEQTGMEESEVQP